MCQQEECWENMDRDVTSHPYLPLCGLCSAFSEVPILRVPSLPALRVSLERPSRLPVPRHLPSPSSHLCSRPTPHAKGPAGQWVCELHQGSPARRLHSAAKEAEADQRHGAHTQGGQTSCRLLPLLSAATHPHCGHSVWLLG